MDNQNMPRVTEQADERAKLPLIEHPEPRVMAWTALEENAIRAAQYDAFDAGYRAALTRQVAPEAPIQSTCACGYSVAKCDPRDTFKCKQTPAATTASAAHHFACPQRGHNPLCDGCEAESKATTASTSGDDCPACELPADAHQNCGSPNCAVRGYGPGDACKSRRAPAPSLDADWQSGYKTGYETGLSDGRAEFTNPTATSPAERAALARAPLPAQSARNPSTAILHDGVWYVPYAAPAQAVEALDISSLPCNYIESGDRLESFNVCTVCGDTRYSKVGTRCEKAVAQLDKARAAMSASQGKKGGAA